MSIFRNPFKRQPSPPKRRTFGEVMRNPTAKDREIYKEVDRQMKALNVKSSRMYDAAITTNLTTDFPISITSENAEIFTSIIASRGRARRVVRDNPFARNIVESHIDNIGGEEPFRLEMKCGKKNADGEFIEDDDVNSAIEDWWKEAGEPANCCANGMYSREEMDWQAIACLVRDGGVIYRHCEFYPDNPFNYAIEPIEIDRLDHYYNRPSNGQNNEISFSIEMNGWHRPIAYWILERHPGDVFAFSNSPRYRTRYAADKIIALFDIRTRAGQYVGMSRLSSVIQRLHRIDQFDIAHCTAAVWTACKPLFFVQEFPAAMELVPDYIKTAMESVANLANGQGGPGWGVGQKFNDMEPGSIETLPYGYKPMQMDAKFPTEGAVGFTKDNLRGTGSGVQMPYHVLTGDYAEINFSSGRLGENSWHDTCKRLQRHMIINYRIPHFRKALEFAILSGELELDISRFKEFCKAANFYGRRWPYLQPVQDAQADILRIEAGLDSPSHVIAESDRGGDAEMVYAEIAADRKAAEAHKLDFSGDVSNPTIKKGEPLTQQPGPTDQTPQPKAKGKKSKRSDSMVWCMECHTRSMNGEDICRNCGSDSLGIYRQAISLYANRK